MWFKIKEINPSDWESESPYKASKFVQAIENTFSHVNMTHFKFIGAFNFYSFD